MKLYIIGPSGSGKSFLAQKLAAKHKIPGLEIDKIWLKYGGKKFYGTPVDAFVEEKNKLMSEISHEVKSLSREKNWVIEGNYKVVREDLMLLADRVILLDMPLSESIKSLFGRQLRGENQKRGWSVRDFIFHLYKVATGSQRVRGSLRESSSKYKDKIVILRSRKEVDGYVSSSQ